VPAIVASERFIRAGQERRRVRAWETQRDVIRSNVRGRKPVHRERNSTPGFFSSSAAAEADAEESDYVPAYGDCSGICAETTLASSSRADQPGAPGGFSVQTSTFTIEDRGPRAIFPSTKSAAGEPREGRLVLLPADESRAHVCDKSRSRGCAVTFKPCRSV